MLRFLLLPFILLFALNINAQLKTIEKSGEPVSHLTKPRSPREVTQNTSLTSSNYPSIGAITGRRILSPIKVKQVDRNKMPILIRGYLEDYPTNIRRQATDYLAEIAPYFLVDNPSNEWEITDVTEDHLGMQHLKIKQIYQGVPVFAGELNLHARKGRIETVMGRGFPSPQLASTVPQISEEQATRNAWDRLKNKDHFVNIPADQKNLFKLKQIELELVVYHENELASKERLAYYVKEYENLASLKTYFMDANTGEVIHEHDNICKFHGENLPPDGPTTAVAQDLNGQNRTIDVYESAGNFFMINTTKPNFKPSQSNVPNDLVGAIMTLDAQNKSPQSAGFSHFHVANNDNVSWLDKSSVSAHHNASIAYDYFKDVHGRNAIDGNGGNIISVVNVSDEDEESMDNAFWNGIGMYYGNGKDAFKPLAGAVDVAGHEMSHGVVQTTANLNYEGESGALNESFADVFGAMMDRDDYKMGEDVVTNVFPSGALRDLSNPNNGGSQLGHPGYQPAHVNEQYLGNEDNGGVHINSGIPNFAFYKFAEAVGKDKAEQVYYRALTTYLTRSSRFIDARNAVIQAADDLYGATEVNAAKNAFDQVGIGEGTGGDYTNDAEINPGAEFIIHADASLSKLTLINSDFATLLESASQLAPLSRPSVTDDGSLIYYVNADNQIAVTIIDWDSGDFNFDIVQDQNIWSNVVISKDGNRMAAVESAESNRIQVYDFNLGEFYKDNSGAFGFELYNPTFTEGVSTGDAKYADAMEFDISGEILMYDVYSEVAGDFGQTLGFWDIGFLEVFDNSKANWGGGKISKMFSSLAEDISVGNPTFSKNSPYIIAFDFIEGSEYSLLAANIETGDVGLVFENTGLGYPAYTPTDEQIIFTSDGFLSTDVFVIGLDETKIQAKGDASQIINNATWAVPFRNGTRVLSDVDEVAITVEDLKTFPNPATSFVFFEVQQEQGSKALLEVRSSSGQLVFSESLNLPAGINRKMINVSDYPKGNYSVSLISEGLRRISQITKL